MSLGIAEPLWSKFYIVISVLQSNNHHVYELFRFHSWDINQGSFNCDKNVYLFMNINFTFVSKSLIKIDKLAATGTMIIIQLMIQYLVIINEL